MKGIRLSVFTWSVYMLGMGVGMLLIPDQILDILGIDPAKEVWIRVLGVVAVVLGVYYLGGAIHQARWLFAILDIASAGWTFVALRFKPEPEPIEPTAPVV